MLLHSKVRIVLHVKSRFYFDKMFEFNLRVVGWNHGDGGGHMRGWWEMQRTEWDEDGWSAVEQPKEEVYDNNDTLINISYCNNKH